MIDLKTIYVGRGSELYEGLRPGPYVIRLVGNELHNRFVLVDQPWATIQLVHQDQVQRESYLSLSDMTGPVPRPAASFEKLTYRLVLIQMCDGGFSMEYLAQELPINTNTFQASGGNRIVDWGWRHHMYGYNP